MEVLETAAFPYLIAFTTSTKLQSFLPRDALSREYRVFLAVRFSPTRPEAITSSSYTPVSGKILPSCSCHVSTSKVETRSQANGIPSQSPTSLQRPRSSKERRKPAPVYGILLLDALRSTSVSLSVHALERGAPADAHLLQLLTPLPTS